MRVYELALNLRVTARDVVVALRLLGDNDAGHLTSVPPELQDMVTKIVDSSDDPRFSLAVRCRRLESRLEMLEG